VNIFFPLNNLVKT